MTIRVQELRQDINMQVKYKYNCIISCIETKENRHVQPALITLELQVTLHVKLSITLSKDKQFNM